jgi:hypothetical protein
MYEYQVNCSFLLDLSVDVSCSKIPISRNFFSRYTVHTTDLHLIFILRSWILRVEMITTSFSLPVSPKNCN